MDGFLSGGGFFPSISPPPFLLHIHTHIDTHTHTHTKQVVCLHVCLSRALCHLDLLGLPKLRPPQERERERRENIPLRKRVSSCCLWLNHESDASKPSSLLPVCFDLCVCVCLFSNFWIFECFVTYQRPLIGPSDSCSAV